MSENIDIADNRYISVLLIAAQLGNLLAQERSCTRERGLDLDLQHQLHSPLASHPVDKW